MFSFLWTVYNLHILNCTYETTKFNISYVGCNPVANTDFPIKYFKLQVFGFSAQK